MPSAEVGGDVRRNLALNCWLWVRSLTHTPAAVIHSPAVTLAAWPTIAANSTPAMQQDISRRLSIVLNFGSPIASRCPCSAKNIVGIISKNMIALVGSQLMEHWQRELTFCIADLIGEVGTKHNAIGTDEINEKAQ